MYNYIKATNIKVQNKQTDINNIEMKDNLIHEISVLKKNKFDCNLTSYPNKTKEVEIPGCGIKVDFCEKDGSIHEVKMSKSVEKAHILQLAYYLKVFADKSEQIKSGTIHYPRLRKTQNIYLTDELRCEVENLEKEIQVITGKKNVPNEFPKRNFCRRCSYCEFCFS